jgi:response regulator RpfG family c-di-GMP phosphodiesterase
MPVRKPKLLLVDDDAQCLSVRRILFEAFDFKVVSCTNPKQGLRLYQAQRFDAAVIDFQMPEMNGGELAERMKKARPDVPVAILSGLPCAPEGTPECYDRFLCKMEPNAKIVKEVNELIALYSNKKPHKVKWPTKVSAAVGIAVGFASEGASAAKHKLVPGSKPLNFKATTA